MINWFDWLITCLYTDMELEESFFMCPRNQGLRYMMNGCTHLNGTESRLAWFLFYDDCSSYMHKSELDFSSSIPAYCIRMEWKKSFLDYAFHTESVYIFKFWFGWKKSFGMHCNTFVICLFYLKKDFEWGTFFNSFQKFFIIK